MFRVGRFARMINDLDWLKPTGLDESSSTIYGGLTKLATAPDGAVRDLKFNEGVVAAAAGEPHDVRQS